MTESVIHCHKKNNFILSDGRTRYKRCASFFWWRLVTRHGDIRKSKLFSIFQECKEIFIFILTYYSWFQIHHYSPWHVLPSDCFIEKRGKRVIVVELTVLVPEGAIRLNAMLQAEEFPARISYLNSSLADMNRDALTLGRESRERVRKTNVH